MIDLRNPKYLIIGTNIVSLISGFLICKQFYPTVETRIEEKVKWKTKVETKIVDKIIYKDRVKTKTLTRTITKPDGTIVTEKEDTKDETSRVAETRKDSRIEDSEFTKETLVTVNSMPNYSLSISLLQLDKVGFKLPDAYNVSFESRLGKTPLHLGLGVITKKFDDINGASISLRFEF